MFAFFKDELEARKSLKAFFHSQNYNKISLERFLSICGEEMSKGFLKFCTKLMYRWNRSFNIPSGHLTFLKIIVQIPPLPGPKCRSNAPHQGPFGWSNAPTPGTFHRHINDRKTVETPWVVEQNLYKYNKNWETLLAYLLRTKVSCKAAEIAATRSLNAQLFFVMQHTKRSIKKDPTYWDYYIMTISLTCIIAHLINYHTCSRSK